MGRLEELKANLPDGEYKDYLLAHEKEYFYWMWDHYDCPDFVWFVYEAGLPLPKDEDTLIAIGYPTVE